MKGRLLILVGVEDVEDERFEIEQVLVVDEEVGEDLGCQHMSDEDWK